MKDDTIKTFKLVHIIVQQMLQPSRLEAVDYANCISVEGKDHDIPNECSGYDTN